MSKKFYVTTPIYYASGDPHIGHAFSTIYADVLTRYKKLIGYETIFATGMDEHGQKILDVANQHNKKPQEYVDFICEKFKNLWHLLGINYTHFIRTTSPNHEETVINVVNAFKSKNLIYRGMWESLYSVKSEENVPKDQAIKNAEGKLVDQFGHELVQKKEESFFYKMKQSSKWIGDFLSSNKNFIIPQQRIKELVNSFINVGVEDLSISRKNLSWGIGFPNDEHQTIYVWIDALFGYMSILGFMQKNDELYKKFWASEDCEIVHVMSKEIMRFHGIYWPIMLHDLGVKLPTQIISHGWLIMNNEKMSKSLGNVVNPIDLISKYGRDILRYFLLKEMSLDNDVNFSEKLLTETFNADLANIYGNLVSRFIGMVNKYNNGVIQKTKIKNDPLSNDVINELKKLVQNAPQNINTYKIKELIFEVLDFSKKLNKYVEQTKPWLLAQENKTNEINHFLFVLANGIRTICCLLRPILIDGCEMICDQMQFSETMLDFNQLSNLDLIDNHKVGLSKPIYLRKQ